MACERDQAGSVRNAAFRRKIALGAAALLNVALPAGGAWAQAAGCRTVAYTDPPREVLDCADGLSITAEKGASYKLLDRNRDGRPEAVELTGKGLLIEYSGRRGGFQVLTPHAIASVRGTIWAVDVKATGTSVFVQQGRVGVARPRAPQAGVVLGPGNGVDVEGAGGPLAVQNWSSERRLHLLARFGR